MKSHAGYFLFFLALKALIHNSVSYLKCENPSQRLLPLVTGVKPKMASENIALNSDDQFALDVSKNYNESTNSLVSPLSVASPFVMLSFGARGITLKELVNVFHIKSVDMGLKKYQELTYRYANLNSGTKISLANMLLFSDQIQLLDSFKDSVSGICKMQSVNFEESSKVQTLVNEWVQNNTQHKLMNIMRNPPDPFTKLIIVNAIYFKGTWEKPFSKAATRKSEFTNFDSSQTQVDMMYNQDTYFYKFFEQFKMEMIEMPYQDGFSMFILLPNKGESYMMPFKRLTLETLTCMLSSLVSEKIELFLPKFNYSYEMDLKEELQKLGLKSIFDAKSSKLTDITTDELFVSEALHKTMIIVNEEGTEATGATFVKVSSRSLFLGRVVRVNRPFCFFILDKVTSNILFTGCVNKL